MSRLDRVLALVAYFVALSLVFAVAAAFGSFGPFELLIALLVALPLAVPVFRWLRAFFGRRSAATSRS